jgi:acyl-CoA reductase-like NAD-dependent aldehyde dehydrogenase
MVGAPPTRASHWALKTSGVGRDLGSAGIDAWTEEKVVSVIL